VRRFARLKGSSIGQDLLKAGAADEASAAGGAGRATLRRQSLNTNSGISPSASTALRWRLPKSPQCSAAGVIFA
jgi:hypothetical protein